MNWEACAKQRYVVLEALGSSSEWSQADAVRAVQTAVKAFPDGDPAADAAAVQKALGLPTATRVDGTLAQAMLRTGPVYGIDFSPTAPVIAGIKAALAQSLAARKAAESAAAMAAPLSEAWLAPIVCGTDALFNGATEAKLLQMVGDPGMRARFGGSLDVLALQEVLQSVSGKSLMSLLQPIDPSQPIALPLVSLPVAGLNAGDVALALLQTIHIRDNEDRDAMSMALFGHPSSARSMYSGSQKSLTPRIRRSGDTLEIGYDIDKTQLSNFYKGKEQEALAYIQASFAKLRSSMANGAVA